MSTLIIRRTIHMKTAIKITAVALVAIMLVCAFASCAKTLSGSYSNEAGLGSLAGVKVTYKFEGSKVTVITTSTRVGNTDSKSYTGKYELATAEDGTESIKITMDTEDGNSYAGTKTFKQGKTEEDKEYIEIGGVRYTKN